jgi:glycosyltransferase involved in cell wall biosynthesis
VKDAIREDLARTAKAPLLGHVRMLGYVSHDDRLELYREARMLVLPSFEEGFGLPVLEAMACGVPVVVSNRGSLPEVVGAAASPLDPIDVEGFAREMERLLDPETAKAAAAKGLVEAARYTWEDCARAAREAYRCAAAARARRTG